jgi:nitrite reductase/ring-hydroxylating ferredoxin subunit
MTNYISRLLRRRLQRRRFLVSTSLVSLLLLYLVSISATVESIAQSSHQFATYRQQQQRRRRRGILVDLPTAAAAAAAAQPCQRYQTHHSKVLPNDDDDDTENATQSGDLLRTLGGFIPFFSSQPSPPKQQPIEQNVPGGFWGGLFRRDSNTNTDKASQPNNKTMKKNRRDRIEDTSESSSTFQRIQALNPLNSRKPDRKADKSTIQPENTNYNPLSVVQKFAGSFFQNENDPSRTPSTKETWYPVFPKTRIMPGEMVPVIVAGIDLLVIATIDGRSLYCIANSCPHLGTPLETGKLLRLPTEIKSPPLASETMTVTNSDGTDGIIFSETDISNILSQDGCEDCIICPLHRTAFALKSGEVRGEWCPYPPVIGAIMGTVKTPTPAAVFEVRTRGKNIEVRLNSIL